MKTIYFRLFFTIILFVSLFILLISALEYPFKAKIFPFIVILSSLGLLSAQILLDIFAIKHKVGDKEVDSVETEGSSYHKLLEALIWVAMSLVGFLLFGHVAVFFLLPFAYSKLHHDRWWVSISLSLGCGIGFYVIFDFALSITLYKGYLFPLFFE